MPTRCSGTSSSALRSARAADRPPYDAWMDDKWQTLVRTYLPMELASQWMDGRQRAPTAKATRRKAATHEQHIAASKMVRVGGGYVQASWNADQGVAQQPITAWGDPEVVGAGVIYDKDKSNFAQGLKEHMLAAGARHNSRMRSRGPRGADEAMVVMDEEGANKAW